MLTSNVQLGYVLTRGGGQAVQGGLSCPPPRISNRMDNPQSSLLEIMFTSLTTKYSKIMVQLTDDTVWPKSWAGDKINQPGQLTSHPSPRISERMDNPQILLHHLLQEYLVERDINFTEMLTSNVQLGCVLTRGEGGGQAVQGGLSCPPPPPRISERMDNPQILLHLLQEYLV